jgi:pyruvate/2-oxoglutarate dehydrogenase complex dihydrolipoamide acyltransferase (E2) component
MSSDESEGSLKDFIVKDDEIYDSDETESEESEDSEEATEDTDSEAEATEDSEAEATEPAEPEQKDKAEEKPVSKKRKYEDPETIELLKQEAAEFAAGVTGTVVNGRTLRSRDPSSLEKRKPKDEYYERFGRADEEKLMEKFTKKDMIDFLKALEKDNREAYEAAGHEWPTLNVRMPLEEIREKYDAVKAFLDLPDSDAESDAEESIDSDEEMEDDEEEES